MGRPRLFDPADALDAAMLMFWEHGYSQTSMAQLVAATGASRASLYSEFGDKKALFESAMAHYSERVVAPLVAGMAAPGAGLSAVREYLQTLLSGGGREAWGCLACTTAANLAANDAHADALADRAMAPMRAALKNALEGAAKAGDLNGRDVDGLAVWIFSTVVGTAVLSRTPSGRPFAEATLRAMLADLA